jgi:hypothetical protein
VIPKISYTHAPGIKQDIIRHRNRWKDQFNFWTSKQDASTQSLWRKLRKIFIIPKKPV